MKLYLKRLWKRNYRKMRNDAQPSVLGIGIVISSPAFIEGMEYPESKIVVYTSTSGEASLINSKDKKRGKFQYVIVHQDSEGVGTALRLDRRHNATGEEIRFPLRHDYSRYLFRKNKIKLHGFMTVQTTIVTRGSKSEMSHQASDFERF